MSGHMRIPVLFLFLGAWPWLTACPIAPNDPLPFFGANCALGEARCGIEHVCQKRADATGAEGTCVPVVSYGAVCDDIKAVSHPPGRVGDDVDNDAIVIKSEADAVAFLDNVRSVTGQVRIERPDDPPGPQPRPDFAELENLCSFRDLQIVGNGLGISEMNLTNLDGLQSVTSIVGGLAIFTNPSLESLDGLANLSAIEPGVVAGESFDVAIVNNRNLPEAVAAAFLDELEARVGRPLDAISCGNDGPVCPEGINDVVQQITTGGFRR